MDLFKITSGFQSGFGTQKFPHIGLRRYDPMFASNKFYRDAVISSNILRKAAQLVAQIENARNVPKNPVEELLKMRGNLLDKNA